jgi:hypothetical protein
VQLCARISGVPVLPGGDQAFGAGAQLVGRTLPDSNGVLDVGQPPSALTLRRDTSSF